MPSNVGDSPTAKVRMSPLAMSVLLKQELGVDIVMHYTTRDRNAMAIHSDMVGAHVLDLFAKPFLQPEHMTLRQMQQLRSSCAVLLPSITIVRTFTLTCSFMLNVICSLMG